MDQPNPALEIPEFNVWEDDEGFHATWAKPLGVDESHARIPEQADARHIAQLEADCAWLRIRRDLAAQSAWRRTVEIPFRTGDPT
jgi:hypothetical protein